MSFRNTASLVEAEVDLDQFVELFDLFAGENNSLLKQNCGASTHDTGLRDA